MYVVVNQPKPDLLARAANRVIRKPKHTTNDAEIMRRIGLVFDVDPVRSAGISSTDAEKPWPANGYQARRRVDPAGWPEPIVSDSGNGEHARYKIDLPNDDESRDLVKRVLEAADALFSDDAAIIDTLLFNASRIVKLPGTWARKGDSTPDRPHRLSRILFLPDDFRVVPVELLEAFADRTSTKAEPGRRQWPGPREWVPVEGNRWCQPRGQSQSLRVHAPRFDRWPEGAQPPLSRRLRAGGRVRS